MTSTQTNQITVAKGHFLRPSAMDMGVAKILVGRNDINLDKPDNGGRMPLSWAAVLGKEEVVKVLQYSNGTASAPISQTNQTGDHSGTIPNMARQE